MRTVSTLSWLREKQFIVIASLLKTTRRRASLFVHLEDAVADMATAFNRTAGTRKHDLFGSEGHLLISYELLAYLKMSLTSIE
jgi:hypothetical protein